MNSNILNIIGLGEIDIAYFFIGFIFILLIIIILLIIQCSKLNKLKKKYNKFMDGSNAESLEKEIMRLFEDNRYLRASTEKNKKDIRSLFKNMENTFQKVGVVKYDAFNQMGGKLSFSLALLDGNDNGFILNSVHSSDGCYSYTKEIKKGICEIALGEEEENALNIAMEK